MDADTWLDVVFTEEEWGDFCSRLTRGTDRKLRGKIQRINILSRVPEKRRIQVEADEIKIDGLAVILPTNQRMGLECFASTECVSEAAVSSYVWKNEVATHDTIRSNFARLQKSLKKKSPPILGKLHNSQKFLTFFAKKAKTELFDRFAFGRFGKMVASAESG